MGHPGLTLAFPTLLDRIGSLGPPPHPGDGATGDRTVIGCPNGPRLWILQTPAPEGQNRGVVQAWWSRLTRSGALGVLRYLFNGGSEVEDHREGWSKIPRQSLRAPIERDIQQPVRC